MQNTSKTYLFEEMPVSRAVMSLSIPTVLGSMVMILYNLADTYFVGMLNDAVQNSAVTLAAPLLLAFNAVNNLFGVGSASMMSRALGRKDLDTVRRSSAVGFWCALFCGVLFSVLASVLREPLLSLLGADEATMAATGAYMFWTVCCGAVPAILNVVLSHLVRAEGGALHASLGTMSGCLLNILLDPLFILPQFLDMGAAGAGLATFLANTAACLYYLLLLAVKKGKTFVTVNPRHFTLAPAILGGIAGVGIPASIQNLLNVTGMTVFNNLTSAYGPDAVAAMGIAQKINQIPFYAALGLSQGIMPLISYNYASHNIARMKKALVFTAKIALSFLLLMSVIYYLFAPGLIGAFMENETIVTLGTAFLRGFCLGMVFLAADFLAVGVFQAVGYGRYSLLFAILRKIVLEIPFILLFNTLFPLYGLAYSQLAAEVILAAAALLVLTRLFKKWSKEAQSR